MSNSARCPNYWTSTLIVGQRKNLFVYAKNGICRPYEPKSRRFALFGDLCSSNRCSMAGTDPANGWKQGCFTPRPSLGVKFKKERPGAVAPCQ
jgi:hypothetical protein